MITKWKIFNFKSIQKETPLEFAPLTIFAGANSSGKSTVLQSILLISQTLAHRVGSRSVALNGALIRLGQFDDLRSYGSDADQIVVGWECRPRLEAGPKSLERSQSSSRLLHDWGMSGAIEQVSCEISFDTDPSSPRRDIYQLQPRLFSCQLSAIVREEDSAEMRHEVTITRTNRAIATKLDQIQDLALTESESESTRGSLEFDVSIDSESLAEIREVFPSAEPVGCFLRHFLPERLSVRVNSADEEARMVAAVICDDRPRRTRRRIMDRDITIPMNVIALLEEILGADFHDLFNLHPTQRSLYPDQGYSLADWTDRMRDLPPARRIKLRRALRGQPDLYEQIVQTTRNVSPDRYELVPSRLPPAIMDAVAYLDHFFSASVRYLGPLRDEPKPLYPLAALPDPSDVGLRGELTAAVLDLHKNKQIRYIPASHFGSSSIQEGTSLRSLQAAVTDWMRYLGVAEDIESRDLGKLGHELKVSTTQDGQPQDLTHVGVGVSQVLPILVSCLLADSDTSLIFEQPELHLHPRVQTLLGDFFLSMALVGKQCIVETHSEYLISRLRFRAAAAPAEKDLTSNVKMYFVEKHNANSSFRDVHVNEYGAILDWPEGFFDQSQREAEQILRAALSKKDNTRSKRKHDA